ncbi:MAG TPA: TldD/PmbA family protein [Armatimonadota bacterium]|nr:TldD/PmbA family protein [Armatimonadota bacterium]
MNYLEFAQDVVRSAVNAGAHQAEVYIQTGSEFHVDVRMGEIETLAQASAKGLGLRVFVDKRMAFASTTDFHGPVVADLMRTTVNLAKAASRDRYNGLPDVGPGPLPHLNLYDPAIVDLPAERKIEMAREAEKAAFDCGPRITNSYGAGVGTHVGTQIIANSNGVLYSCSGTDCTVSCAPMAEGDGEKQFGHHWSAKRFFGELEPAAEVGRQAAIRALQKLGARKVETQTVPVVFDWMVGPLLWEAVFHALDGDGVHRGMSFLKNMLGKQVASPVVTLVDDPLMPGGLGSVPFDGEGVLCARKVVIENGILKTYFYDARTARKYGQQPSGNARRGFASLPSVSPTNLYLKPTNTDPSEIIRGIANGFYVTQTMGYGVSTVTGDFSVGAVGMWICNGELAFPVQEVTIAGNMLDMMRSIEQVANDARFISSVVSPTFKVAEMTVSGK